MKTVLFICVHNSGRSQIAEALFNRLAEGRARAFSAGTNPADALDSTVIEAMREIGMDMSGHRPKALTPEMAEQADKVVTMGCGVEECPATMLEAEDWGLEDPKGQPLEKVRQIREEIKEHVSEILRQLDA